MTFCALWKKRKLCFLFAAFAALGLQNQSVRAGDPIFISAFNGGGGGFDFPTGVATTNGTTLISDFNNNRVQVFNSSDVFQQTFLMPDGGSPIGIAVENNGNIHIVDSSNSRIDLFNPAFNPIGNYGQPSLGGPTFIALDSQGRRYVTDEADIRRFLSNGALDNTINFAIPGGFSGGGVFVAPDARTAVADSGNNTIQVFNPDGSLRGSFGIFTEGGPNGLALGQDGIYAVDSVANQVQIFDFDGNPLSTFGTMGNGDGQFNFPYGIFVQNTTGRIFVTDGNNNRVHVWFNPAEWTQPGTSNLVQLPLNQPLALQNRFNLQVQGNTTLQNGADLALLPGSTFQTDSLNINGGALLTAAAGTTAMVTNNFVMAPSSGYQVGISSNNSSGLIAAGGLAGLNGNLNVTRGDIPLESLRNQTYTIVTAGGGVNNAFVTANGTPLSFTNGQSQTLISSDRIKFRIVNLPNAIQVVTSDLQNFEDVVPAEDGNTGATARYFDRDVRAAPGSDLAGVVNVLDGFLAVDDREGVRDALDQIQPSTHDADTEVTYLRVAETSEVVSAQQADTRRDIAPKDTGGSCTALRLAGFQQLVHQQLSLTPTLQTFGHKPWKPKNFVETYELQAHTTPVSQRIQIGKANVWLQSFGQVLNAKGNSRSPGFRAKTGGLSIGGDYEIFNYTYAGVFGGLSESPFDVKNNRGHGDVKSYYGGLYGTHLFERGTYVDGQIMAGGDRYNRKRRINFSTIHRTAKSKYSGAHFFTKTEVGQIVPLSYFWSNLPFDLVLQPFVSIAYALTHQNKFRETGAQSLNFRIKSRNNHVLRGEVGSAFYRTFLLCGETLVRPELSISYIHTHRLGKNRGKVKGGLIGQPQTLTVKGDTRTIHQVAPAFSLTAQFNDGLYVIGNVRGELGKTLNALSGVATLGYNF